MKLSPLMTALALLVLVPGCCEEDQGLTVHGSVTVAIQDAETGFAFGGETRLADDAELDSAGAVAGHCTLDPATGTIDVGLSRSGVDEEGSREIRSFSALLVDGEAGVEGEVGVVLGQESFEGSGEAGCALGVIYTNEQTGQAGIEADCGLASGSGEQAELAAELHFRSCLVLEGE